MMRSSSRMVHGIQRVAFALTALGVLLLAACTGAERSGRPQVGVTLLTEVHVFYQDSKRGMLEAADSLGLDLRIVAGEWDLARQTAQVQNFITRGMDAIVIAPVNSSGIVSAVSEANEAGIPVFTAGIAADAVQDPVAIGRRTMEVVAATLREAEVPPLVAVPVSLVTRDSLVAGG